MEILAKGLGAIVLIAFTLAIAAFIGGTILYFIYDALPIFLPGLVERGYIAKELDWWTCVRVVWIFAILIKSLTTVNNKN